MKKLYCSNCKKYVEEPAYDFISGMCKRCLVKEMKGARREVPDDADEDDDVEEEEEEDGE